MQDGIERLAWFQEPVERLATAGSEYDKTGCFSNTDFRPVAEVCAEFYDMYSDNQKLG